MVSLNWSDSRRSHTVFCSEDTVQELYSMLLKSGARAIHIYAASSGAELDPERGLAVVNEDKYTEMCMCGKPQIRK